MVDLPPNVKEFNEITAVIFAQLYHSFPIQRGLDPIEVAKVLGISETAKLPSGRAFNEVFAHMLERLIREDFVDSYGSYPREKCVLTTKAMSVMNVVPPNLKKPMGSELGDATQDGSSAANKSKMAELIGEFFGSFTGSMWKSLGNG
jgi:hypothetical protein